jgi:hypothetical protein
MDSLDLGRVCEYVNEKLLISTNGDSGCWKT